MKVGDPVRVYDENEEWFSEGEITTISAVHVEVDFIDWVQRYRPDQIRVRHIFYAELLVTRATEGETISDFR